MVDDKEASKYMPGEVNATEEKSEISLEEVCQALREVKEGISPDVDECRPVSLKNG